ncbi:MAG: hypothetical protein SynsKO_37700 [Synoicihabitans sp.]
MVEVLNQVGQLAAVTWKSFARDRMAWGALGAATVLTGSGGWWLDFNFGSDVGRFLLNYSLSVQALVTIVIAIVSMVQVSAAERSEGTLRLAMAHGIRPSAWVWGQMIGIGRWIGVYLISSTLAIGIAFQAAGIQVPWPTLVDGGLSHLAVGGVVISFTRWFASYLSHIAVVSVAAGLFAGLGYLKPLVEESGGLGWWMSRPIPNLVWMGESAMMGSGWNLSHGLIAVLYALAFAVVFLALSARSLSRREF